MAGWMHSCPLFGPPAPVFGSVANRLTNAALRRADLLQIEVFSTDRRRGLFTVFNNHLKSHFVPFNAPDPAAEQIRGNELRRRQCEAAAAIIAAQTRSN